MFGLTSQDRYHLYMQPTDMRKGFEGLSGLVEHHLARKPRSGEVFIFINKRRDKVKLLRWGGSGYTLYYKRLEEGTFELPRYDEQVGNMVLNYTQLVMLIDGVSIQNLSHRKRFLSTAKTG